ncbi:hypothetical protein [Lysinibacillus sp. NPDC056232]|uniref:hypothetical protein n=1 Tax=Lysinibacillus sp. NPDC056232 TaxID=3345756 RepID=UPI0035DF48E1
MTFVKHTYWSGGWATSWGLASQMKPWSASEAVHRTLHGKRPVGMEINPTVALE